MTKREFTDEVLHLLNEAGGAERQAFQLAGADTATVPRYVAAFYRAAWQKTMSLIPREWWMVADFAVPPVGYADGTGYVRLPADWYALHSFRMEGWERAVTEAFPIDHPVAAQQMYRYARGTARRPVCVIAASAEGGELSRRLYYYSVPPHSAHVVGEALYVQQPQDMALLAEDEELRIDAHAEIPLACLTAALAYQAFENAGAAKALEEEALKSMGYPKTREV